MHYLGCFVLPTQLAFPSLRSKAFERATLENHVDDSENCILQCRVYSGFAEHDGPWAYHGMANVSMEIDLDST